MKNLIVVPTYDESLTITDLLAALARHAPDEDVLVVEDHSPDGTADLVRADPRFGVGVFLLQPDHKDGLGAAYRAGFAWAPHQEDDGVVQMDADLSHPHDRLPALIEAPGGADVAVGSRYVPGGAVARWTRRHRLLSWGGNRYTQVVLGPSTHDTTAGFKAFRSSALRWLEVASSTSNGFCFQVEKTWRAERRGPTSAVVWRIREIREIRDHLVHLVRSPVHPA